MEPASLWYGGILLNWETSCVGLALCLALDVPSLVDQWREKNAALWKTQFPNWYGVLGRLGRGSKHEPSFISLSLDRFVVARPPDPQRH